MVTLPSCSKACVYEPYFSESGLTPVCCCSLFIENCDLFWNSFGFPKYLWCQKIEPKFWVLWNNDKYNVQSELLVTKQNQFNKLKVVQCCLYSYRQRYSSSQWSKCCELTRRSRVSPQQILTTVMTNIIVDKSTDDAEPLSICFTTIFNAKKVFVSERDQNHDTKKRASVAYNFLVIWLVHFPKWAFLIGY